MKDFNELTETDDLQRFIAELIVQVRDQPQDLSLRSLLFESCCFAGQFERAEKQVTALLSLAPQQAEILLTYRCLLTAEQQRQQVFAGKLAPAFLTEPADSLTARWRSLQLLDVNGSGEHLAEAEKCEVAVPVDYEGTIEISFRDFDDRLGPVLEFIERSGLYLWINIGELKRIVPAPLIDSIDLLWRPATLELREGMMLQGYLPTLYPESFQDSNDLYKLGKMTRWEEVGDKYYRGVGQRIFLVGEKEVPVLELHSVTFCDAGGENDASQSTAVDSL